MEEGLERVGCNADFASSQQVPRQGAHTNTAHTVRDRLKLDAAFSALPDLDGCANLKWVRVQTEEEKMIAESGMATPCHSMLMPMRRC